MARAIAIRLSRPSTALLLLCCCLAVMVGWQAIIGAETGGGRSLSALLASISPPPSAAGAASPDLVASNRFGTATPQAFAAGGPSPQADTVLTFQQGVNSYTGTVDTWIDAQNATTSNATAATLRVDLLNYYQEALIRFDNIFGSGPGQIPAGSTITDATLTLSVPNTTNYGTAATIYFHRVLQDWAAANTYNTFGAAPWNLTTGVQADGVEAAATADATPAGLAQGAATAVTVTSSLQAWLADPASNHGWVLLEAVDDGLVFESSEAATAANRPLLTVTFTLPAPCTGPGDCSDGNPCTDDVCDLGTGGTCLHPANTAVCSDGNPCTDDICSGGACVGTANNGNACSDGVDCTDDECSGGTCVATSTCVCGEICNTGTGQCDAPSGLPVATGETWRYFKGTTNPPAAWRDLCFDDAGWFSGPGGFGYGLDCTAGRGTTLSDMTTAPVYQSIFTRHVFNVPSAAAVTGLNLVVDYDDGFVAYLNGTEIARSSSMAGQGTLPPFNATPTSHECSTCNGTCNAAQTFPVNAALLVNGANVLAIQAHNDDTASSDFTVIARLEATNPPPSAPTSPSPADTETGVSVNPQLCVTATDPSGDPMTVTFKGRVAGGPAGEDFTIIVLPDTQFYSQTYPQIYAAQTQWIVDNRVARNIVFVTQLGDCVNNWDQAGQEYQWPNASAAWDIIESAPGLPEGIPYGIAVGNHDNGGNARSGSNEEGTTIQWTKTFGLQRMCPGECSNNPGLTCEKDADCGGAVCNPGPTPPDENPTCKSYYGGRYDFGDPTTYFRNTDNHYELFSAGGMDFIIFHLEWDCADGSMGCQSAGVAHPMRQQVIDWMDNILTNVYPNRRAIVSSHFLMQPSGNPPAFTNQGQAVYNALQDNQNVFMTLCGHLDQANRRRDEPQPGHVIHSMITDYQTRPNGGDGWLRILTFHPQTNTITAETYSPYLGQFIYSHADNTAGTAQQQFTLDYAMDAGVPFAVVGSQSSVGSGTQASVSWPGRESNRTYEWYAELTDGTSTTVGPRWTFTTDCQSAAECDDGSICTTDACDAGTCTHAAVAGCCLTAADCNDAQACTDDTCVGNVCEHANNTGACTDSNACTAPDVCSGGSCQSGAAVLCDDANDCTTDDCSEATGCVYDYAPTFDCCVTHADCDDGIPGTIDTCTDDDCSNVPSTSCNTTADCDDGNVCTTDSCAGGNVSGLSFDGANDNVDLGNAAALTNFGTGSFTIEGWVYTDGGNADRTGIIRMGRQDDFMQVAVQLTGTTAPYLAIAGSVEADGAGDQQEDVNYQGVAITPNAWHHFAMIVDRSTLPGDPAGQELRLHIDGGPAIVENAADWGTNTISSTDNVILGAGRLGGGGLSLYYDGRLDEVRIWDHVRTPQQIQDNMNLAISSGTGLLHRWGLDEGGTATTTADSVGTSHGTLNGGTAWLTSGQIPAIGPGTCSHVGIPG